MQEGVREVRVDGQYIRVIPCGDVALEDLRCQGPVQTKVVWCCVVCQIRVDDNAAQCNGELHYGSARLVVACR